MKQKDFLKGEEERGTRQLKKTDLNELKNTLNLSCRLMILKRAWNLCFKYCFEKGFAGLETKNVAHPMASPPHNTQKQKKSQQEK